MEFVNNDELPQGETLQKFNITSLWHKSIFDSLMQLQEYEKLCYNGAIEILNYLEIPPDRFSEIQVQYLKMAIVEMSILLSNSKIKLTPDFFKKSKKTLIEIEEQINKNPNCVLLSSSDVRTKEKTTHLNNHYFVILKEITNIREGLVEQLSDILFPTETDKTEERGLN